MRCRTCGKQDISYFNGLCFDCAMEGDDTPYDPYKKWAEEIVTWWTKNHFCVPMADREGALKGLANKLREEAPMIVGGKQ